VLDTEHGCFNNETLYNCIQIITAKDKTCLVRLTEINKTLIRMCLDAGASGLIFSTIEDASQAAEIKKLCTYPKYGGKRGLGLVRQNKWGYSTLVNKPPIIIAQIETKRAVHNLEEIYAQGLDHYMIGPFDLSASLGVTAEFNNPKFLEAIETINRVITDPRKMAVHIPTDVNKYIDKYAEYAIIAVGMDTTILLEGYKELV
jgi:2-dehydro-3-deoxyglucarate aldolase